MIFTVSIEFCDFWCFSGDLNASYSRPDRVSDIFAGCTFRLSAQEPASVIGGELALIEHPPYFGDDLVGFATEAGNQFF